MPLLCTLYMRGEKSACSESRCWAKIQKGSKRAALTPPSPPVRNGRALFETESDLPRGSGLLTAGAKFSICRNLFPRTFHIPLLFDEGHLLVVVVLRRQYSREGLLQRETPSAIQKIKQLLKDKPEHVGVKVGVRTRGCNGLSYTLEYTKSKGDSDEEVVQDGVRVFIEKKAQLTLLGTEMDYVEDKLSSEFVFNNPNIKGTCGCGESFNI
nr:PREDICTED: uncharacterized protein LOC104139702 [Struthio camelus australis]